MADLVVPESKVATSLDEPLERLLAFEPTTFPVLSVYLDLQAGDNGRARVEPFLKKELANRAKTYPASSPERASFDEDAKRILEWFENEEHEKSANGIALFACYAADLWDVVQLSAPLDENRLYVYNQPHLYHLTRISDEYPRYAALLTDANSARIFLFGLGQALEAEQVKGEKVQRVKVGGWSQARYQRRVDNAHSKHAKETIDVLGRLVKDEGISQIVLAGEPTITALITEEMPQELAEKVVDIVRLDAKAPDHEVLEKTLESMRKVDAESDVEKVTRLLGEYRRGGLACVGKQDTLEALANGQVDELLISATLEGEEPQEEPVDAILAPEVPDAQGSTETDEPRPVLLPDLLVTKAKQTDATVTFIQDPELLADVEGVGAFLRWRV
jgi:peptide subunit release factor 1 (eRF1)